MAYIKTCDNCGEQLGGRRPFLQIHGSISEQIEAPDTGEVMFRYLTMGNTKLAFCDDNCEGQWKDKRRGIMAFTQRPTYPQ